MPKQAEDLVQRVASALILLLQAYDKAKEAYEHYKSEQKACTPPDGCV